MAIPTLLTFFFGVAIVVAAPSRDLRTEPVFWLTTPKNQPRASFRTRSWQAKDAFSHHAVRERKPVPGPSLPFHQPAPDPFTTAFFAQESQQHDPWFPDGPEHFAPGQREPTPPYEPSIFASETLGVLLFGLGMAGWVALFVSACLLERRRAVDKPT